MKTIGISWSDKDRTPAEVKVSGHTPGPWKVVGTEIWAGYGCRITMGRGAYDEKDREIRNANARLIAKAPTMHELLTIIATEVETECTCDANRDKCLHCRIVECLEGK